MNALRTLTIPGADQEVRLQVCPDFRVNDQVLFLGMGSGEGGSSPSPAYLCRNRTRFSLGNSLKGWHPLRPQNGEVVQGLAPVMNRHGPLFRCLPQRQK